MCLWHVYYAQPFVLIWERCSISLQIISACILAATDVAEEHVPHQLLHFSYLRSSYLVLGLCEQLFGHCYVFWQFSCWTHTHQMTTKNNKSTCSEMPLPRKKQNRYQLRVMKYDGTNIVPNTKYAGWNMSWPNKVLHFQAVLLKPRKPQIIFQSVMNSRTWVNLRRLHNPYFCCKPELHFTLTEICQT